MTQLPDFLNPTPIPASEDCLFLKIISPPIIKDKKYEVMVWIHGGGY